MILHFKRDELVEHFQRKISHYDKMYEKAQRELDIRRKKWFHSDWDDYGLLLRRADGYDNSAFFRAVLNHLPEASIVFVNSDELQKLELL